MSNELMRRGATAVVKSEGVTAEVVIVEVVKAVVTIGLAYGVASLLPGGPLFFLIVFMLLGGIARRVF
jgi:hypothetical protein